MNIEVVSLKAQPAQCVADLLILGVFERGALPAATAEVDLASGGAIRARIDAGDIAGKLKQITRLYDLPNIVQGNIDDLIERLAREHQADELARLTQGN